MAGNSQEAAELITLKTFLASACDVTNATSTTAVLAMNTDKLYRLRPDPNLLQDK